MQPFSYARSTYGRLLPPIELPFSYGAMEQLGLSMESDVTRMPDKPGPPPPPKVAYTYFGQFIVHDLTRDDTPLFQNPLPEPDAVLNHRTPFLDLDSLYGRGPFSEDSDLYEADGASLKVGIVKTEHGQTFDVPLDPSTSQPLLADDRNNENIIIRQIHAIFLKLHNLAVAELRGSVPDPELFEKVRQRVRWQYQWLVRHDYLAKICNPDIYDELINKGNTRIDWGNRFAIPVEFARAAARFGHSMVRDTYDLNRAKLEFPVRKIFEEAHKPKELDPALAIDWRRFTRDPAHSIDTAIVSALFHLSPKSICLFVASSSPTDPNALPVRTLYRGIEMKIPTGETVAAWLDASAVLTERPPKDDYDPFKALRELQLVGRTPLWYYILLEAELNEKGRLLGAVGSRLVAEVIEGSLHADPDSIITQLQHDPKWRPELWSSAGGKVRIDRFQQLTAVVGLPDPHIAQFGR